MRLFAARCLVWGLTVILSSTFALNSNVTLVPAAIGFEADSTAFYYSKTPLLLANDGSAANGGFRVFAVAPSPAYLQIAHQKIGRSKIIEPIYDIDGKGKDVFLAIAAPDSVMRAFETDGTEFYEIESARRVILGDWSTMCSWRSGQSGNSYAFLFGKKIGVQLLIRSQMNEAEILEVQTFPIPIEGETCAVFRDGTVWVSAEDRPLYKFQAQESTTAPTISTVTEDTKIAGLGAYYSTSEDFLFVAHDELIDVYDAAFKQKATVFLSGIAGLSIEGGLAVLQSRLAGFPSGALAFAFEGDDATGVAVASLETVLQPIGITPDTNFNPKGKPCKSCVQPISGRCSNNGFHTGERSCQCISGFTGRDCSKATCKNSCSDHGSCIGPNICKCSAAWAGPDCSFATVKPTYETDANGGDGDDPAIWVHPLKPEESKIITTTKSEQGAGFAAFDLHGKLLQHMPADEPNNVDVIYNFTVGDRNADLIFAACRGDNTLCMFEVNSTGLLLPIKGGIQPTPDDYEVYGSCAYRSRKTNRQYLFVNAKSALYLQYELTSTANGTLQTALVRSFTGGSGGQVEGCVADEEKGYVFLGEEPEGVWRYDAEPDGSSNGVQIAKVGDGKLSADVEGITLVPAKNSSEGYLFVSSQGISSYLVYERSPPHAYVTTFTIVDNESAGVDHVSNTDGIAAVGNRLNQDFPLGLFVTHDDANELAGGGTAEEASFKLVSLEKILGTQQARRLGY